MGPAPALRFGAVQLSASRVNGITVNQVANLVYVVNVNDDLLWIIYGATNTLGPILPVVV